MQTLKIRYCNEDFISRIPALFAYIDYDEYGNAVLHKATDSDYGCYGKYVENIKYGEEFFSFKTLYDKYYRLLKVDELTPEDENFISFFEEGIGRVKIEKEFNEDQYLVPTMVYLSMVERIRREYMELKKVSDYFEKNKENINESSDYERLCCRSQKYYRMGGDEMLGLLEEYCKERKERSEKFYRLAAKEEKDEKCSYSLNVFIPNTVNDMGILTDYVDEWVPGNEYRNGEMVFHDGQTMVCVVEKSSGEYDSETERIVFPENDFKSVVEISSDSYGIGDKTKQNIREDVYETYEGVVLDVDKENVSSRNTYATKYNKYKESDGLKGYTDSKLRSLRRFQDYQNEYDKVETSGIHEDWLYYYRVGVVHYNMENDEFGNILTVDFDNVYNGKEGEYVTNLMLYGSGIQSIEADNENRTITFKYYEDAHLMCKLTKKEKDDDGNMYYYFSDFEVDTDSEYGKNHGVWYTETYTYEEGGELDELVKTDGKLDEYVSSDNVSIDNTKYAFSTVNNLSYRETMVGIDKIKTCHIVSDFTTDVKNDLSESYSFNSVMKQDYLMGITYQPVKDIEVKVLRGNNAAFERHLKLGEVKSLSDLENYSNGGFYRIEKS